MKVLQLVLPALLFVGAASAQVPSKPDTVDAPTVTVTQISWRQEVFVPALYDDPMRVNQDRDELERDQKATSKANVDRAKMGETPIPQPTKKIASNTPVGSTPMGIPLGDEPAGNQNLPSRSDPGVSSVHYLYEAKIKNTGMKAIRTIVWEYLLFDPDTEVEMGHHRFTGNITVRSGKTVNLVGRSAKPLTGVVEVTKSGKGSQTKYHERVVIQRIEYDDGTFWQRPLN
jgi:hypothetical protein